MVRTDSMACDAVELRFIRSGTNRRSTYTQIKAFVGRMTKASAANSNANRVLELETKRTVIQSTILAVTKRSVKLRTVRSCIF